MTQARRARAAARLKISGIRIPSFVHREFILIPVTLFFFYKVKWPLNSVVLKIHDNYQQLSTKLCNSGIPKLSRSKFDPIRNDYNNLLSQERGKTESRATDSRSYYSSLIQSRRNSAPSPRPPPPSASAPARLLFPPIVSFSLPRTPHLIPVIEFDSEFAIEENPSNRSILRSRLISLLYTCYERRDNRNLVILRPARHRRMKGWASWSVERAYTETHTHTHTHPKAVTHLFARRGAARRNERTGRHSRICNCNEYRRRADSKGYRRWRFGRERARVSAYRMVTRAWWVINRSARESPSRTLWAISWDRRDDALFHARVMMGNSRDGFF